MDQLIDVVRANPLQAAVIGFFLVVAFLAWRIELGAFRRRH